MVKKLEKLQLEADPGSIDYSDERYMTVQNLFKIENKINNLIDLVNSQQEAIGELQTEIGVLRNMVLQSQEAIEKLESKVWTAGFIEKYRPALENLAEADTHRTVTLRIPKGMSILEAIWQARMKADNLIDLNDFWEFSDTDLQKALDEVQG
jgi:hypothetical protein